VVPDSHHPCGDDLSVWPEHWYIENLAPKLHVSTIRATFIAAHYTHVNITEGAPTPKGKLEIVNQSSSPVVFAVGRR